MVKQCAYGTCRSDTRYPARLEGHVVFFAFPKPKTQEERCQLWIKQCGRPHSQLNISQNTHMSAPKYIKLLAVSELSIWRAALSLGMMTNYLVENIPKQLWFMETSIITTRST